MNKARSLRTGLTDAEKRLSDRLRRKQILAVQFYRQKPIGNSIVDFYAPGARLVVGVGWSQHFDVEQATHDWRRSDYLEQQRLRVLRFDDRQVLLDLDSVTGQIFWAVQGRKLP